ncbi:MAG: ferritin [Candidatus Aenigmarchaeota archaeon]|nr:ferritin [Candidatus Aenigmarchaeota archaeon]
MQTKVWRCKICAEPYIGYERPSNCPFCGAHQEYIIPAEDWKYEDDVQLSPKSRKNMEEALKLEISNASFYLCVSKVSKDPFIQGMFKTLSNIEKEHASLHARILKAPKPDIDFDPKLCTAIDKNSVNESLERETSAVKHYGKFLGEAKEPRLREIFKALVDIECDHIQLDREVLKRLK